MSKEFYTLKIGGIERQLQKFAVSDTLDIAAFILFGDVELTEVCARELLKKVPDFDYIVTPEAKSIPLAYEMSKQSGKKCYFSLLHLMILTLLVLNFLDFSIDKSAQLTIF